jgi:hypothetical protein
MGFVFDVAGDIGGAVLDFGKEIFGGAKEILSGVMESDLGRAALATTAAFFGAPQLPFGGDLGIESLASLGGGGSAAGFAGASSGLASLASILPGESGGIPTDILKKLGLGTSPWSTAFGAISGLYGMSQASQMRKLAERASQQQDPFAGQRAGYAAELKALESDPSKLFSSPTYKAGEQAVIRSMASQGYLGSGNMATALQEYGGRALDTERSRLAQLAGAQFAPSGGETLIKGTAAANEQASRALASLGYSIRGFEDIYNRR